MVNDDGPRCADLCAAWMEVDQEAQALRLKYVPVVTQALPGKKAATFFQLERKVCMMVDLQLFSQIPLAHVKQ